MKKTVKTSVTALAVILCSLLAISLFGCFGTPTETQYQPPKFSSGNIFTFDKRLNEEVSVDIDFNNAPFQSLICAEKELTDQDFQHYKNLVVITAEFFEDSQAGDEFNFTFKTKGGNLEFVVSVIESEDPLKPSISQTQAQYDLFEPQDIVIQVDDKGSWILTVYNGENRLKGYTYIRGVLTFPAETFQTSKSGDVLNLRIVTEYGECLFVVNITSSAPAFETFTVQGKVTDSSGNPIGGMIVKTDDKETLTDEDGMYTFTELKVSSVPYEISSEGFPYLSGKTEVTKAMIKVSDGTVTPEDIVLKKGTVTYKIHIYDTFGNPLYGVKATEGDAEVKTHSDGIAQFEGIELDRDVIFGFFKDGYKSAELSCMADDVHSFLVEKHVVMHGGKQLYFGSIRSNNGIYAKAFQAKNGDSYLADFTFFSEQRLADNEFAAIFLYACDYDDKVLNDKIVYKIFGDGSVYKSSDISLKRAEMGDKIATAEMRDHCGGALFSLKINYADIISESSIIVRFTLSKGADGAANAEYSGSELKVYEPSSGASYGSGGTYDDLSSYMGLDGKGYKTALFSAMGTVLCEGNPVKNAKVTLYGQTTTTDEQGRFKFTKLPRKFSDTTLEIQKGGYNKYYVSGSMPGINRDESMGKLTNKDSDHLEMTLQKILLKGTVKGRQSTLMAGVTVRLGDRFVVTDAEGKYEFEDVYTIDGVILTVDGFYIFHKNQIVSEQSYSADDFIYTYNMPKDIYLFYGAGTYFFYVDDADTGDDVHGPTAVVINNKTGETYTTAAGEGNGFVEIELRFEDIPSEGFTVKVSHAKYEDASFILTRDNFIFGSSGSRESIKMTPKK